MNKIIELDYNVWENTLTILKPDIDLIKYVLYSFHVQGHVSCLHL